MMIFVHKLLKNKIILRLASILLIGAAIVFLAGCTKRTPVAPHSRTSKLTPAGLRQNDFHVLRENGIQVIKLGQTVRLVIPSDRLFRPASANLRPSYQPVLNKVAKLLNAYHIVTVKVAAYSDNHRDGSHKKALTGRQAQAVQSSLSDRRIKARLIYAGGRGSKNPVAWNGHPRGRQCNRRVEISFRFYPRVNS